MDARQQRLVAGPVVEGRAGDRCRPERPAVEAAPEGDDPGPARGPPGELEGRFDRLGARVQEHHRVERRRERLPRARPRGGRPARRSRSRRSERSAGRPARGSPGSPPDDGGRGPTRRSRWRSRGSRCRRCRTGGGRRRGSSCARSSGPRTGVRLALGEGAVVGAGGRMAIHLARIPECQSGRRWAMAQWPALHGAEPLRRLGPEP